MGLEQAIRSKKKLKTLLEFANELDRRGHKWTSEEERTLQLRLDILSRKKLKPQRRG